MYSGEAKCYRKTFFIMFLCAFVFSLFLSSAGKVYAINEDYLNGDKWLRNPRVSVQELDGYSNRGSRLQGIFSYYADDENMCLYTNFAIDTDLIDHYDENVRIAFIVRTPSDEYSFAVGKDGICDVLSDEAEKMFDVYRNFEDAESGNLIVAWQYIGKEALCEVEVRFYSDVVFLVKDDIVLEKPTTVKAEKTTTAKTQKSTTSKQTTTKKSSSSKSSGSSGKSSKSSTVSTTKFIPSGVITEDEEEVSETESDRTAYRYFQDLSAQGPGVFKRSKASMLLLYLGIAVGIVGIAVIIYLVRFHKTLRQQATEEDSTPEDDDDLPIDGI